MTEKTFEHVLHDLENLQGSEFDYDTIVCTLEDFESALDEEVILDKIESYRPDTGRTLWQMYRNHKDATIFDIYVNADNILE